MNEHVERLRMLAVCFERQGEPINLPCIKHAIQAIEEKDQLTEANKTIADQCKRLNDEREFYQDKVEQLHDQIEQLKERNSILYSTLTLITGPSPMSFDHQTLKWIRETGNKVL